MADKDAGRVDSPITIALIGIGKIARDQHIPALLADPQYRLAAAVSKSGASPLNIPTFTELAELIGAMPEIEAVSFCTPPQGRSALAMQAIEAGLDVMLEKPPGVTVGEVEQLTLRARECGVAVFASWHSRAAAGIEPARRWLSERKIRRVEVTWKEDVRKWHPGQHWIWQPGGLGVFDPGINALSILTRILPGRLFVQQASLSYPANRETPIAADVTLADQSGLRANVAFDFRQTGDERWDITIDTDAGQLSLLRGGAALFIDGREISCGVAREYSALYERFATLSRSKTVDVDLAPLQLTADAFLLGRRIVVDDFIE